MLTMREQNEVIFNLGEVLGALLRDLKEEKDLSEYYKRQYNELKERTEASDVRGMPEVTV